MNNNWPKVSVIIPLFNQKQFVGEAIESVLDQSYPNIEIIVVNDGSTDDPLREFEKYRDKIILINQENRGLAGARNTGISNSTGDYIQLLDADDFLHKDKIKLQLEFCIAENCDVSYCEISQFHNDTGKTELRYVGEIKDMFPHLYNFWHTYPLPVHSMLIRKDIFQKFGLFDEELKACEDRYFFSKLAVSGVTFRYFPFIGGFRRLHGSNMNRDKLHIMKNTIRYFRKINAELDDSYFIKRFNCPAERMMNTNLTYMYLVNISEGVKRIEQKKIKSLMSAENIKFDAEPMPSALKKLKVGNFYPVFYLKRWFNFFYRKLFADN